MTTRLAGSSSRTGKRTVTRQNALSRLDRAEQSAQAAREARDEAASEERLRLIASWNLSGHVPEHLATAPDAVIDSQLLVMAEEELYQYERRHGPVQPLLPTPDLTPEEWQARTDAEVAGYCAGLLRHGVTLEWKSPREWLKAAEERQ